MKPLVIVGIVLAMLGGVVLVRGLSYSSQRDVLKIGDLKVSAEEDRAIPAWVGGVALAGGLILLGAGSRARPKT